MELSCTDMRNQHIHFHRVDIQKLHIKKIATREKVYKKSHIILNIANANPDANYLC